MSTSLWSLVDKWNLQKKKKNAKDARKRRKSKSVFNFIGLKNNKLNYECKECKKRWFKPVNGLIKKVSNIHQFCNGDVNKFVLLLRKSVYPYEYMNSSERLDETSLPYKKAFYSELNLEDITDEHSAHAQKVLEKLKLKTPW